MQVFYTDQIIFQFEDLVQVSPFNTILIFIKQRHTL